MTEVKEDRQDKPKGHDATADDSYEPNNGSKSSQPDTNTSVTDVTINSIDSLKDTENSVLDVSKQSDSPQDQSYSSAISQTNQQMKLSLEQQLSRVKKELESMVIRYARSEAENLQNKAKGKEFETKLKRAIKDNESLANRIKILTNDKNHLTETLSAKVAQLTVLEQKNCSLNNAQEVKLKELEAEVEQLRKTNEDLLKSIDTYKSKENELLDFSERLSMKQLLLQTELDKALDNAPDHKKRFDQLAEENVNMLRTIEELKEHCRICNENLTSERKLVAKLKAEQEELELKGRRNQDELENEMKVLKRKHQVATKELLKQIKYLQGSIDKVNNTHGNKAIS